MKEKEYQGEVQKSSLEMVMTKEPTVVVNTSSDNVIQTNLCVLVIPDTK